MEPLIEFNNATLGYGSKVVLSGISFTILPGEYLGIVGPNGAGKTTIIRTILGSIPPIAGEVKVHSASGGDLRIGYVPQRDTIDYVLPYTVREVVMMGRYRQIGLLRRPGAEDREVVRKALHTRQSTGWPTGRSGISRADRNSVCSLPGRLRHNPRCLSWTSRPTAWTSPPGSLSLT